jgi:hypothetical protein
MVRTSDGQSLFITALLGFYQRLHSGTARRTLQMARAALES